MQLYNHYYILHPLSYMENYYTRFILDTFIFAPHYLQPFDAIDAFIQTKVLKNIAPVIDEFIDILYSGIIYVTAYIVCIEVIAVLLNALGNFLPFGAGALGILASHYVRLATTLTPATSARIIFEEFETLPTVFRRARHLLLGHSAIYETDDAIKRICELI